MADALDNLIAAVPLIRTEGGLKLTHPTALPIRLPTPCLPREIQVLFAAMAEGWLIDLTELRTTASQRPSKTRPRRRCRR